MSLGSLRLRVDRAEFRAATLCECGALKATTLRTLEFRDRILKFEFCSTSKNLRGLGRLLGL